MHPVQAAIVLAPVATVERPGGHSEQDVDAVAFAYDPTGQTVHAAAFLELKEPVSQDMHACEEFAPASDVKVPAPHETHVLAEVALTAELYVPAPHKVHDNDPVVEYVPTPHATHDVAPSVAAYEPPKHKLHVVT